MFPFLANRFQKVKSTDIERYCFGCFAQQLRLRREVNLALRMGLGTGGVAHVPMYFQQRCALLGVKIATPYHRLFCTDKGWDNQTLDSL